MKPYQIALLFLCPLLLVFGATRVFAGKDCARTEFKTDFFKQACAAGGQKAAKKAAWKFVKSARKATGEKIKCSTCHTKVSGDYPLEEGALEKFQRYQKAILAASEN